jgi:hypothetical protein
MVTLLVVRAKLLEPMVATGRTLPGDYRAVGDKKPK